MDAASLEFGPTVGDTLHWQPWWFFALNSAQGAIDAEISRSCEAQEPSEGGECLGQPEWAMWPPNRYANDSDCSGPRSDLHPSHVKHLRSCVCARAPLIFRQTAPSSKGACSASPPTAARRLRRGRRIPVASPWFGCFSGIRQPLHGSFKPFAGMDAFRCEGIGALETRSPTHPLKTNHLLTLLDRDG